VSKVFFKKQECVDKINIFWIAQSLLCCLCFEKFTSKSRKNNDNINKQPLNNSDNKKSFISRYWLHQHLPMSAILKPQLIRTDLRVMILDNFYASFIFYAVGMVLSAMWFIVETLRRKSKGRRAVVRMAAANMSRASISRFSSVIIRARFANDRFRSF
jgi:hypothetical protein